MIASLMLLPWVASLLDPRYSHAGNFTIGLMLSAFVSGALLLSGYTSRRHRANGIELLLIMVLFWSFLPVIAAIPFIGASQIDSLVAAYFVRSPNLGHQNQQCELNISLAGTIEHDSLVEIWHGLAADA